MPKKGFFASLIHYLSAGNVKDQGDKESGETEEKKVCHFFSIVKHELNGCKFYACL